MRRCSISSKCAKMSKNGKMGKSYFRISLFLVMTFPTQAFACHHFARWYYPYPQPRCGVYAKTTAPEDKTWYVEITAVPPIDEDSDLREVGIEKLKQQLK